MSRFIKHPGRSFRGTSRRQAQEATSTISSCENFNRGWLAARNRRGGGAAPSFRASARDIESSEAPVRDGLGERL